MLQEFCFTYEDCEHRLVYSPSRPTNVALREIFEEQVYPYLPFLAPAKVILDVGANVGFATVLLSTLYPTAKVYAFEPSRDAFDLLVRNTAKLPQVQAFPYGLLDREASLPLFGGLESTVTNSLGASCHNGQESEQVLVRQAQNVLEELGITAVSLLKLDTEGAEIAILANLRERFADIDAIMLEYHAEADRRFIDGLLAQTHVLYACRSKQPHRGTMVYVAKSLIEARTTLNCLAITLPVTSKASSTRQPPAYCGTC